MPLHPAASDDCERCHGQGLEIFRGPTQAQARTCGCVGPCPDCRDSGFVAIEPGPRPRKRRCRCQVLARRVERLNALALPARHASSTLRSYKLNKDRMQWFHVVNRYIRDFRPGEPNRGLVLYGDVGRGKTHLLVAVLRELVIRYGVSARFVEFSHLLADIKSGFGHGHGTSHLLDPLTQVEVLAIDELGKGRNTEFDGTVLDELISRRYNNASVILGTTNYAPRPASGVAVPNLAGGLMPTLEDRVGPRVFSRLQEMCAFAPVLGDDYRLQLRSGAS